MRKIIPSQASKTGPEGCALQWFGARAQIARCRERETLLQAARPPGRVSWIDVTRRSVRTRSACGNGRPTRASSEVRDPDHSDRRRAPARARRARLRVISAARRDPTWANCRATHVGTNPRATHVGKLRARPTWADSARDSPGRTPRDPREQLRARPTWVNSARDPRGQSPRASTLDVREPDMADSCQQNAPEPISECVFSFFGLTTSVDTRA